MASNETAAAAKYSFDDRAFLHKEREAAEEKT
jgi:hypothetical protein